MLVAVPRTGMYERSSQALCPMHHICINKALWRLKIANDKRRRSMSSSVPDFDRFGILQVS